jgi:hypothetical protein
MTVRLTRCSMSDLRPISQLKRDSAGDKVRLRTWPNRIHVILMSLLLFVVLLWGLSFRARMEYTRYDAVYDRVKDPANREVYGAMSEVDPVTFWIGLGNGVIYGGWLCPRNTDIGRWVVHHTAFESGFRKLPRLNWQHTPDGPVGLVELPLWIPFAGILLANSVAHVFWRRVTGAGKCACCGYSLKGLSGRRCPECGTTFDPHLLSRMREASGTDRPAGSGP